MSGRVRLGSASIAGGADSLTTCEVLPVSGNASCPCINSLADFGVNVTGHLIATVDGVMYNYGLNYGENGCATHDALRPPHCRIVLPREAPTVEVVLDRWCFQPWCYVNATRCIGSGVNTAIANYKYNWWRPSAEQELHYSYETCDVPDLYTASLTATQEALLQAEAERVANQERVQLDRILYISLFVSLAGLFLLALVLLRSYHKHRIAAKQLARRLRTNPTGELAKAVPLEDGKSGLGRQVRLRDHQGQGHRRPGSGQGQGQGQARIESAAD